MEKEQWLFVYTCGIGVKPGALLSVKQAWTMKLQFLAFFLLFTLRQGLGCLGWP